jgi:glycosyltransferase involved in cell wall biosynthesis
MTRPKLSLVIPCYNESETIPELHRRLAQFLSALPEVGEAWETVFIDDGSRDDTGALLTALARNEPRFKVVLFARNFGHQIAITAGLDRAEGDAVVVMDADLQDPPEVVKEMLKKAAEGHDVVFGVRRKRHGETFFKRFTAAAFYRFIRAMTGVDIPVDAGDFRLMTRPVVLTMRALREQHRFVRGMVAWVGFKQAAVYYDREARHAGETKYPLRKMLKFAIDGITSFSVVPLRVAVVVGLVLGVVKFFAIGMVPGWTGIMVAVTFGFSAQLLMTGILGEYVGRIYEEIKRRPLYVTAREVNLDALSNEQRPDRAVLPEEPPRL